MKNSKGLVNLIYERYRMLPGRGFVSDRRLRMVVSLHSVSNTKRLVYKYIAHMYF
ncbi:hypothetical protein vBSAP01_040 [Staphylococcus phage vB_SAP01]|nr:hypothetical protein vBSAP01_040 [Staphylococcus phage vB_SAP01]